MYLRNSRAAVILSGTLAFLVVAQAAFGQREPLPSRIQPYSVDSGRLDNATNEPVVVFDRVIDLGSETPWARLSFESTNLPPGSAVRITSLMDGGTQTLDAEQLALWQGSSAYFNGSSLRLELIAGPNTFGNSITIAEIMVGRRRSAEEAADKVGICGGIDNRVRSFDPAVGRLLVTGKESEWVCTGFIADTPPGPDKCHLSAGHCFDGWSLAILQFNVPDSGPTVANPGTLPCDINHPAPADQYVVSKVEWEDSGKGDDWAVFRCVPNAVTGLTTFLAQGAALPVLPLAQPPAGTPVSIPGYGVDGGVPNDCDTCAAASPDQDKNHIQQDDPTGLFLAAGTQPGSVAVDADVCGGDSGAPMIAPDGFVYGILTWGKCKALGYNSGTPITHGNLQAAIAACKGDDNTGMDPPNAPDWWCSIGTSCPDECACGDYWAFGKWDKPVPGANPAEFCSNWLTNTDFTMDVTDQHVTITLENAKVSAFVKDVYIYVAGQSPTGAGPTNLTIRGDNTFSGQPDSGWAGLLEVIWTPELNGWAVTAKGTFKPQPDLVILEFDLAADGVISHAWAGECCHVNPSIPTVTAWGLCTMALLVVVASTVVIRRRMAVAA